MIDLRPLRINSNDRRRRAYLGDQFSEAAAAATNVEPLCARRRRNPVKEHLADTTAPAAHEALIGGSVVESISRFCLSSGQAAFQCSGRVIPLFLALSSVPLDANGFDHLGINSDFLADI